MENRPHNGYKNYKVEARRWLLRRDWGRVDARLCDANRDTRFYDAHDHRIDCRRWRNASTLCSEVGRSWQNRLGMDPHDSCRSDDRSDVVLAGEIPISNVLKIESEPKRGSVGFAIQEPL